MKTIPEQLEIMRIELCWNYCKWLAQYDDFVLIHKERCEGCRVCRDFERSDEGDEAESITDRLEKLSSEFCNCYCKWIDEYPTVADEEKLEEKCNSCALDMI